MPHLTESQADELVYQEVRRIIAAMLQVRDAGKVVANIRMATSAPKSVDFLCWLYVDEEVMIELPADRS